MKKIKPIKGFGVFVLGAVILAISLFSYVAVSLDLAESYILGAGQVAGLGAGAVYLVFFQKKNGEQSLKKEMLCKNDPSKKAVGEQSVWGYLKETLWATGYAVSFVCFFCLLTFPLQNLLAKAGLASINECVYYENFWEMILYGLILPPVCLEVLHRLIVTPALDRVIKDRWKVVLLSGLFYLFSAPQLGNLFARLALGALLALLFLRTGSFLACFCVALVAQSVFFIAGYMQILGFAGAESYTFLQCLGMGLTFAAPGAAVFYANEKLARKRKVKIMEILCLVCLLAIVFVIGLALWLS